MSNPKDDELSRRHGAMNVISAAKAVRYYQKKYNMNMDEIRASVKRDRDEYFKAKAAREKERFGD